MTEAARGLAELIDRPAAADPERRALVVGDRTTTYGALAAMARGAAAALVEAGVRPGWRVALVDEATEHSIATLIGAARAGTAAALMNPRLTAPELGALVASSGAADVGVAGRRYAPTLVEAGVARVIVAEEIAPVPPGADAPVVPVGPDDEAAILFTSGTTGLPKAVPMRHGVLGPRVAVFSPTFDAAGTPAVSLMCVPLVHVGGMLGLLVTLARGDTQVIQHRFDAGEWLELVERHRVEAVFVVPTMLHRILAHPAFATTDLSSLRSVTYGAAPAPPELIRRAMDAMPGASFSNVFGQTETLGSITALAPDDHRTDKVASVGRPLPGVEVRVVDPVTGEQVPSGAIGELWVKTAASVLPEAAPPGPRAPDGWLRTGDLVSIDEDGYLYPAGRMSDTINRGGEKFAPMEIEAVLREHPAIEDVAVAGVPDAEMAAGSGWRRSSTGP